MFKSYKNEGMKNAEMAMILLKTQDKSVLCPHLRFCVWFQLLHQKDPGERQRGRETERAWEVRWEWDVYGENVSYEEPETPWTI